ncbi:nuclear transport factor 2 family protein [Nocardia sp. NPDC050175]|uniref:nuclear transport factor 2 family protein n=1 Tax=Nocardia sp. NPDC050175 TaxID=3364317 RepID=UPI0037B4AA48
MNTATETAEQLYTALAKVDIDGLKALLTDDFVGEISAGMPHGVAGPHHGPEDMVHRMWGVLGKVYDIHVDPSEYLAVGPDRVVVLGRYWGPARNGDTEVDAAFAHIITTRGEQISHLVQITDTARWGFTPGSTTR